MKPCKNKTGVHDHNWFMGGACQVCGVQNNAGEEPEPVDVQLTVVSQASMSVRASVENGMEGITEPMTGVMTASAEPCPYCGGPSSLRVIFKDTTHLVDHGDDMCPGAAALVQDPQSALAFVDAAFFLAVPMDDSGDDEEMPDLDDEPDNY